MGGSTIRKQYTTTTPSSLSREAQELFSTPQCTEFIIYCNRSTIRLPSVLDVASRDKADAIKNALMCAQVLSYCASMASKLSKGLTVALLELLATTGRFFGFIELYPWFDKPSDLQSTFELGNRTADLLWAFMVLASYCNLRRKHGRSPIILYGP